MQGTLQVPLRGPAQPLAAVRSGACEAVLRKQSAFTLVSSVAASMRLTPLRNPPHPATDTFRCAHHGRKKEELERVARCARSAARSHSAELLFFTL